MASISRRTFLFLAGASGAAAAAERGHKVVNKLIPYVVPPENIPPGTWTLYSSTCRECPAGCGIQVRCVDGRPIKAEGNPDHPVNRGGLCPRGQSGVQGLYDPDRVRHVQRRTRVSGAESCDWKEAIAEIGGALGERRGRVAVMSDLQTGTLAEVMARFASALGSDRLLYYEPFSYEPLRVAHERLFGLPAIPDYRLDKCDFIISLAADFLESWISNVEYAHEFARMRTYRNGRIGRMAYIGSRLSMTAANADDFLRVPPGAERAIAMAMLKAILDRGWAREDTSAIRPAVEAFAGRASLPPGVTAERVERLARRFVQAKGSVALAGPVGATGAAATETAAAAALLNYAAGRIGETVSFSAPHALGRTATAAQTKEFLAGLTKDDILIIHNANPAYSLKGSEEDIRRAKSVVFLGTMPSETAELADWVLPVHSPFEAWGDYEPREGVHNLIQPTLAPLHDTREAGDVFLALAQAAGFPLLPDGPGKPGATFQDWVRHRWRDLAGRLSPGESVERFWGNALRAGGVWEERRPAKVALRAKAGEMGFSAPADAAGRAAADSCSLWAWPSVLYFDGRVSNRGWLQEAPDPMTSNVWGSWVDLHPRRAGDLGVADGDVIELSTKAGKVEAPVRITEDVDTNVAAIALGQGHTALGRYARGVGANAFALLGEPEAGRVFPDVTIRRTGRRDDPVSLSATQQQFGRKIVQWMPLSELRKMKSGDGENLVLPLPEGYRRGRDIYAAHEYKNHRWAMVVDLARCIGCGACAVACYAENNITVNGREQVGRGREMAWLKAVPYRDTDDPKRLAWLPLFCQQCDAAPCEPVCPVFASVHSEEGLNAQVYNRCIGTRYCSHNCPYKVRRFNWFNTDWPEPLNWQLNPEVTVRSRGVMEKCTFCIQRIRGAEYQAKVENRTVREGEIVPACAQSCPTQTILFGDLLDPNSKVSDLTRRDPRRYHLLENLNTKPAVTFLRRIKVDEEM